LKIYSGLTLDGAVGCTFSSSKPSSQPDERLKIMISLNVYFNIFFILSILK
jgi:hypothetical protein